MQRTAVRNLLLSWALLSLVPARVPAQPAPAMEYLGEAHVDGGRDHDNIKVTAARGPFRAIQIRVEGSGIRFARVIVHYGDGQAEPVTIRNFIPAGQQTRLIQLAGGPRLIRSVEFYYARARWRGPRPHLRLLGSR